jgi:hypothetical protein
MENNKICHIKRKLNLEGKRDVNFQGRNFMIYDMKAKNLTLCKMENCEIEKNY